jgi:predicted permease
MMNSLWQDVRYALRGLRRAPGFTFAAALTLALGIGANVAIFSVVDAVVLHPLPFPEPDRLVALYGTSPVAQSNSISYPNFLDWQRETRTFEALAIWRPEFFVLDDRGQTEQLQGQMVSADFFPILRVRPLLGRMFTRDDDQLGGRPVALLGEGAWRRRFGGNPHIVGEPVTLNGRVHTVIGVIPDRVRLLNPSPSPMNDVFTPIGQYDDDLFRKRGAMNGTLGLGRLKPGVTLSQSVADMTAIARSLERAYPGSNSGAGVRLLRLQDDVAGSLRPIVLALFGAVGFVLLIACANVANLFLARCLARSGEFGVRLSLGASRGRLVGQLLMEGLLLSAIGGVAGIVCAASSVRLALQALPMALPPMTEVDISATVVSFSAVVSLVVAILVGLVPALRITRHEVQNSLKPRGDVGMRTRHRTQRVFVIAEVALTLVLLVGAGLMIQSLTRLWAVSPGFSAEHVLTFLTSLSADGASSPNRIRAAYRDINDRLSALPGVESASVEVGALPFTGSTTLGFWREDQPRPSNPSDMRVAQFYAVGQDYFRTMQIPVLRGRAFTRQDDTSHLQVLIVDEELARRVFPNQDPIGKRIRFTGFDRTAEIVGIVGHIKHAGLDLDASATVRSQFYMPFMQVPDIVAPFTARGISAVVRSNVAPSTLLPSVKKEIGAVDGGAVVHNERTMTELVARSLASRRFSLTLMSAFAGLALLLSIIGLYGVVSYLVGQRTREIGVRTALGAKPRDVLWLVLGEGQKLAVAGVALGLLASLFLTRLIANILYGISAHDPLTLASIAMLLIIVTLAACYVPARRALRVDPATALRAE